MDICRTCLSAVNLCEIFPEFTANQLILVTGIKIKPNDGFPQKICDLCIKLVRSAITLRDQSTYADEILQKEGKLHEDTNHKVKIENNCENDDNASDKLEYDNESDVSIQASLFGNFLQKKKHFNKHFAKTKVIIAKINIGNPVEKHTQLRRTVKKEKVKTAAKIRQIIVKETSSLNIDDSNKVEDMVKTESKTLKLDSTYKITDNEMLNILESNLESPKNAININNKIQTSKSNLDKIYKILDEDLKKSKSQILKTKPINNLTDIEKPEDTELDTAKLNTSNELTDLYKIIDKDEGFLLPSHKKVHDKSKSAKLWKLAVQPVFRDRLVKCSVCSKQFKSKYFTRHATIHFDAEFTCEVCGKKFVNIHALGYHQQRAHGAPRKHACMQCQYQAVHKDELLNHINRFHTGARPFVCDVCAETFCQRRTLVQHMRKHYGVKQYECEFCHKMYVSRSVLCSHRSRFHLLRYTFHCYLCTYQATQRSSVRKHLTKNHGIIRDEQQHIKLVKEKR